MNRRFVHFLDILSYIIIDYRRHDIHIFTIFFDLCSICCFIIHDVIIEQRVIYYFQFNRYETFGYLDDIHIFTIRRKYFSIFNY